MFLIILFLLKHVSISCKVFSNLQQMAKREREGSFSSLLNHKFNMINMQDRHDNKDKVEKVFIVKRINSPYPALSYLILSYLILPILLFAFFDVLNGIIDACKQDFCRGIPMHFDYNAFNTAYKSTRVGRIVKLSFYLII